MECPSHQENSQRFGTATRKRTSDEAGASDNLNPDLGYTVCSKKPCTAYDLASQQLQYGGFTTSSADHQSWSTELSGQLTASSSSMEGSISADPWGDASVPLQILGARTYTTLNIATGQLGLESNWLPDFQAGSQQVSNQDFPVTEVLFGENCETFGLYDSAVVQPALDGPMGFCQPGDLSLLSGIVPQSQFNDMEIEPETDFSITDAADMRLSSASQADQSPWTDRIGAIEPATASTTPQTAPGGTDYELKGSNDDLVCDTCFGVLLVDNLQIRDGFIKDSNPVDKKVLLEIYGRLIIIRDSESNSYGGLIPPNLYDPLQNLITDTITTLSSTLKSTTVLEVLVYGSRTKAAEIGEMLLHHDCFLQQPDSFDDSVTYFNPHCLTRAADDDSMPTWDRVEAEQDTPAENLSVVEKSKVAELLDSASGPMVYRDIQVSEMLQVSLKKHQRKALAMMVEKESGILRGAEFPSVWTEEAVVETGGLRFLNNITGARVYRKPKPCLGGLIADDMGLGKTLTTLALIAGSVATHNNTTQTAARATTLIVAPLSTLTGWQEQIQSHLKAGALRFTVYHGSQRRKSVDLLRSFDIVLTTYETVRAEHLQTLGGGQSAIHKVPWHRIVLDEAHVIQNRSSKNFQAVCSLQARHRWCLTGTPIQNRLEDLGSLVEFLRVDPVDSPGAFRRLFLDPISRQDPSGWERLRALIKSISVRRTKESLKNELGLPARQEEVCKVSLGDEERRAYDLVKRRFALAIDSGGSRMSAFQLILRLRQICNHGVALLPPDLREWINQASRFGPQIPLQIEACLSCGRIQDDDVDDDGVLFESLSCGHQVCPVCRRMAKLDSQDSTGEPSCPCCRAEDLAGRGREGIRSAGDSPAYRPSSKVRELLRNLDHDRREAAAAGVPPEKSVIFSIWTGMLDLIGTALTVRGIEFQRLDGTKTHEQRCDALRCFRSDDNCGVLLASIGSAAVGLNLTVASRVHIIEPGWNPMLEQQALQRVHRLGQTKIVKQIRYVVDGADSVERYILKRQEWKLGLIDASVGGFTRSQEDVACLLEDMRLELGIDAAL